MQPSQEQRIIIENILQGNNVIVDAVAGSGKSTVVLMTAEKWLHSNKNVLQITYNSMLRKEVQEKTRHWNPALTHLSVHTYHSLAVAYYSQLAHNDIKMQDCIDRNVPPCQPIPFFDLIVLDEIQDMTFLYYRLVVKFIVDMFAANDPIPPKRKRGRPSAASASASSSASPPRPPIQLLILGDIKQSLYEFKGADPRFLTHAATIWRHFPFLAPLFVPCSLKTSYRVTHSIAEYVNRVMLGEERLQANKEGGPVKYIVGSSFDNEKRTVALVRKILNEGHQPDDIFILSGSVKNEYSFVRRLENKLSENNIPCHVPRDDQDRLEEQRIIQGKVVFSTFHSVKGRQRPFVFVLGFDSSYTHMIRHSHDSLCPNTLYVACTRASKEMFLFETERDDNRPLPFLQMGHRQMESQDYIDFVGISRGPMWYIAREQVQQYNLPPQNNHSQQNVVKINPIKLIEFLNYDVIQKVSPLIDTLFRLLTPENDIDEINIPTIVQTDTDHFEDVSDINGVAIPCMFYSTLTHYPPSSLYELSKKNLADSYDNQFPFLKQQVDEMMPRTCETTSQFLLSANIYTAVREKLYSKLKQIHNYDWIPDEKRQQCIQRMQQWISPNEPIEVQKFIVSFDDLTAQEKINAALHNLAVDGGGGEQHYEFQFSARVDALTDQSLWEFKFVPELSIEHFIRVMIYAWIWLTLYPKQRRRFMLFNIRTNHVYELTPRYRELTDIVILLIQSKYGKQEAEKDQAFVEKCHREYAYLL